MNHLLPNSDSIAQATFTGDGVNHYPWKRDNSGEGGVQKEGNSYDYSGPLYYGQATDPVYVITACTTPSDGIHDPRNMKFHVPSGANYSCTDDCGDRHIAVWDQTNNLLFSSYAFASVPTAFPDCPSGGHAGTDSDPCPVGDFHYCAVSNWDTDPGWGIGGDDSLGNGGWATHIREKEIISGHIPHAIYLDLDCVGANPDGSYAQVFPSTGGAQVCDQGKKRPPLGALFFLDYTQDELNTLQSQLPSWQFAFIEAMTKYGGYFGDTSGLPGLPLWGIEGPRAYQLAGMSPPLYDWLTSGKFDYDPTNGDPTKPLSCYASECDFAPWVNVPLLSGPNCAPPATCDISQHLHIADPCIALGLAGRPGGCVP